MAGRPTDFRGAIALIADVPDLVVAVRDRRQLSLRDAAHEIGVSHNTLTRVEHGGSCSTANLIAILAWLDDGTH